MTIGVMVLIALVDLAHGGWRRARHYLRVWRVERWRRRHGMRR